MRRYIAISVAALLLTACASGTASGGSDRAPSARRDANVITAEEIATTSVQTLYDAVRNLRPAWMMRSRPTL